MEHNQTVDKTNLIELHFQNNNVCIYSSLDWEKLRREYRIVGVRLGSSAFTPTLPVALLPEETFLLVNKGVAKLIHYPLLQEPPSPTQADEYCKLQKQLLLSEQVLYREGRRNELEQIIDKIISGKKKKTNESRLPSREEVLEEELNKSCDFNEAAMVWPILTEHLECFRGLSTDVPLTQILNQTNPTKCAVYADLWEKGYYITSGIKFGGDFLVYLGEPIAYHAVYIVQCIEDPDKDSHISEIVAFGRLGTSVKKRAVLASVQKDGSVSYITLSWLDT